MGLMCAGAIKSLPSGLPAHKPPEDVYQVHCPLPYLTENRQATTKACFPDNDGVLVPNMLCLHQSRYRIL